MKKWETYDDIDWLRNASSPCWCQKWLGFLGVTLALCLIAGISYGWVLEAMGLSREVAWSVVCGLTFVFSCSIVHD